MRDAYARVGRFRQDRGGKTSTPGFPPPPPLPPRPLPHRLLPPCMMPRVGTVAFDTVGLVARLPAPDTTARVRRVETRHGGTAGNVAVALARLGAPPAVVAAVGPDFPGSAYARHLAALGVDTRDLVVVDSP